MCCLEAGPVAGPASEVVEIEVLRAITVVGSLLATLRDDDIQSANILSEPDTA